MRHPPPGATPPFHPGAVIGSAQAEGFVKGLFDFSFETFIALKVMRVLYGAEDADEIAKNTRRR